MFRSYNLLLRFSMGCRKETLCCFLLHNTSPRKQTASASLKLFSASGTNYLRLKMEKKAHFLQSSSTTVVKIINIISTSIKSPLISSAVENLIVESLKTSCATDSSRFCFAGLCGDSQRNLDFMSHVLWCSRSTER
jgi:hypothetical protein